MTYNRSLQYLILLIFLFFAGNERLTASVNQTITHKRVQQEFSFNPYPDQQARYINQILLMIAEGSGKLRAFTKYQYEAELNIHIRFQQDNQYLIIIKPEKAYVKGDVFYRDFSLENVLIPDRADMRLRVTEPSGAVLFEDQLRALRITERDQNWLELSFSYDGAIGDVRIEFIDYRFYYDESMQNRMTDWANALGSYYEASEQLELIHDQIEGLQVGDPDKLLLDEFILCDAESAMAVIQSAPFHQWINIKQNDPEAIYPFYKTLNERLTLLRVGFNHAIANIDSLYYEYGVMMMSDTITEKTARKYLKSALAYNPFHVQSHIALARLDASAGDKEMALDRLGGVIEQMYPAGLQKLQFKWITDSVLDLFYDEAQSLILERRFIESLAVLDHVALFCERAADQMMCPPLFSMLVRRTHIGIYESFLVVSRRALRNDNLSLAAVYIQSALDYQQSHSEQVREANDALDLLFQVLTRYRIMYELTLILEQHETSFRYYEPARDIIERYFEILDYVIENKDVDQLKSAVLNYAVLGFSNESISLLRQLKELNIDPSEVAYQQTVAGSQAAKHFGKTEAGRHSGDIFREYSLNDPWFRTFRGSFVKHW